MLTTLAYPSNLPSNLASVPIVDLRPTLPVNPRYTWETLHAPRNVNQITTVVFHHDAISKDSSRMYDDKTLATRIARSHINTTKNLPGGDGGFPYHGWVRNGTFYIANNPEALTFGVSSNNDHTIHICVSGEYSAHDKLADQDRNALYVGYFLFRGWMTSYQRALGHKEIKPTACPGYSMDVVRSDLTDIEEQMQYNASPTAETALLYAFVSRVANLGHTLSGNGVYAPEARRKLMLLSDVPLGITGDVTAEAIVQRVADVWKHYDRYPDEAGRKLNAGAAVYKEKGLLG